ncbi:MAG TPA: hypothetical protein VJ818_04035 [Actinomycetota bacterium]|nr:hypothetical protein [Actinomycetota bacterium]
MYRRPDGSTEQFRCAPGPMGWRYFSQVRSDAGVTNVDLSVDAAWRPVRVRIQTPVHHLLLSARGPSVLDDEQLDVTFDPETTTIDFPSPCFPLATARRLGGTGEIVAIAIDIETLRHSSERHRFEAGDEQEIATPAGRFVARAWRHVAARPGFSRALWIAGDVVVAADGLELAAYDPGGRGPRPVGSREP